MKVKLPTLKGGELHLTDTTKRDLDFFLQLLLPKQCILLLQIGNLDTPADGLQASAVSVTAAAGVGDRGWGGCRKRLKW
jgi:hypothetical protein